ncbi:hypothetical protein [Rhodococcoides yunnanense]|uniref:hypothetical protein n=1 Tax=Rhodococcoides yunnanense TaxID=278209 RepID=UPI000932DEC9|nr:hypothetical protein [Rhodococcus yunnanensis]
MSEDGSSLWQSLGVAADRGQLTLNAEAAGACSRACTTFIDKLKEHQAKAADLANVEGLGSFESGKDLRRIFSEKAVGGPNNLFDVLQSHIDVVERMKAVFDKLFAATTEQDEMNAVDLGQREPR